MNNNNDNNNTIIESNKENSNTCKKKISNDLDNDKNSVADSNEEQNK
jgi:hypothetical protein